MKKTIFFLVYLLSGAAFPQNNCMPNDRAFKDGEVLNYIIYYNWGILRMNAGEASSRVLMNRINDVPFYHFICQGENFPQFSWFFNVKDKYESFADTLELKPFRFMREVNEGRYYASDDYIFNRHKKQVYITEKRKLKEPTLDTLSIASCVKDVITSIFYFRCIDFTKYKTNDTIPVSVVLDGQIDNTFIRYMGIDILDTELFGKIRCLKFKPKLIEGVVFKEGEGMTIWVTDDKNRLPVFIETGIVVGSLKVKLINYKGLRNKIECYVLQ